MRSAIFYYTGTGNSLWVARLLSQQLGDTELISISYRENQNGMIDVVGLIFPVHAWGVPMKVLKFASELKSMQPRYIFAVAVNAGQVANTLIQLAKILEKDGLALSLGFEIKMPSNYIPWGGPGSKEEQQQTFELADAKVSRIATCVKEQKTGLIEKGPLWERIVFTPIYKMSLPYVPKEDRKFWVDEKCNKCGICSKVCPAQNITLREGKPVWNGRCEQCFACLQWCPKASIQIGKKTPRYERYHHPEIQLKDILNTK
jgi:ferredoxin